LYIFVQQCLCAPGNLGILILATLIDWSFDSNLWTLLRGVLPPVKYHGSLPISKSMFFFYKFGKKHIRFLKNRVSPEIDK
jgi:hypothetical protein